jgi:hypothetical protein
MNEYLLFAQCYFVDDASHFANCKLNLQIDRADIEKADSMAGRHWLP